MMPAGPAIGVILGFWLNSDRKSKIIIADRFKQHPLPGLRERGGVRRFHGAHRGDRDRALRGVPEQEVALIRQ